MTTIMDNIIQFPTNQKKDSDKLAEIAELAGEIAEVNDAKYVLILTKDYDDNMQISCLADELDPLEIISTCNEAIRHAHRIMKNSR